VTWIDRDRVSTSRVYLTVFFLLIVGFTYFYVSVTFNPADIADNMKKYGGFVPGIRPGKPTEEYLSYVLTRLTAPGAAYLGIVAMLPMIALGEMGLGTSSRSAG
jgi:preprotein translocase subunit SecY